MTAPPDVTTSPKAPASAEPPAGPSDEALLARAAARDDDAFAALYDRWSGTVMAFAYHLTYDRGLAEDVVQEAFLRVWRFAGGFREGGKFAPWVLQIARRLVYDREGAWRRARSRGGDASTSFRGGAAAGAGAGAAAIAAAPADAGADVAARRAEVAEGIREALLALSEPLRETFVLVRLCGASYAAASEALECPVGTVKSRMASAEAALRSRLARFL